MLSASVFIFIFRDLIVRIILKTGSFSPTDANLTSACLGALSIGLFAQSLTLLTTKAFYAIHNTITPAIASIMALVVNVILAVSFVKLFSSTNVFSTTINSFFNLSPSGANQVVGLALAFSFSSIIQFIFLQIFFRIKVKKVF